MNNMNRMTNINNKIKHSNTNNMNIPPKKSKPHNRTLKNHIK